MIQPFGNRQEARWRRMESVLALKPDKQGYGSSGQQDEGRCADRAHSVLPDFEVLFHHFDSPRYFPFDPRRFGGFGGGFPITTATEQKQGDDQDESSEH